MYSLGLVFHILTVQNRIYGYLSVPKYLVYNVAPVLHFGLM